MKGWTNRLRVLGILAMGAFIGLNSIAAEQSTGRTNVKSGVWTRVGHINLLDQATCKPLESEVVSLSQPPKFGEADIRREAVMLTQNACVNVPVQGYAIYYQSAAGFTGSDTLAIEFRDETRKTLSRYFFPMNVQ